MQPFVDRIESAWRLALTLRLGDTTTATQVVERALESQPDLRAIPADRADRLIVLRSREMVVNQRQPKERRGATQRVRLAIDAARAHHRTRRSVDVTAGYPTSVTEDASEPLKRLNNSASMPPKAQEALAALAKLDEQPREAWVLARLFQHDSRATSRAMDCSTSAVGRHLAIASDTLEAILGDGVACSTTALRSWLDSDAVAMPAGFTRRLGARKKRRSVARLVRIAIGVLIVAVALTVTVILIMRGSGPA